MREKAGLRRLVGWALGGWTMSRVSGAVAVRSVSRMVAVRSVSRTAALRFGMLAVVCLAGVGTGCGNPDCPEGYEEVELRCVPVTGDEPTVAETPVTMPGCPAGKGDCDGNTANGCETEIQIDRNHCGACGAKCGWGPCIAAVCEDPVQLVTSANALEDPKTNSCAVLKSGRMACWGANLNGELGNGAIAMSVATTRPPSYVRLANGTPLEGVVAADASNRTTCALLRSGRVLCWGSNRYLLQKTADGAQPTPAPVYLTNSNNVRVPLDDAKSLSLGLWHPYACVQRRDNAVWCWGANFHRELGQPNSDETQQVVKVQDPNATGLHNAPLGDLSAGDAQICALLGDKRVACWGDNTYGALGSVAVDVNNPYQPPLVTSGPQGVGIFNDVQQVEVGGSFACLLAPAGVYCFGHNGGVNGKLGISNVDMDYTNQPSRVKAPLGTIGGDGNLRDVARIALGGGVACAVMKDHRAACWGGNGYLQAAAAATSSTAPNPAPAFLRKGPADATPVDNIEDISCGGVHCCARTTSNGIVCWGNNDAGQLGDGTTTKSAFPVAVQPLSEAL